MHSNNNDRGIDLIFLAELPIGVVPDRREGTPQTVTFELAERPGRRKKRQLVIDSAASLGLPTLVEMQIFVCLMAYTREQNFPDRVLFRRSWLIRDLGWTVSKTNYDRLRLGMDRLQGTSYRCYNHYPDPKDQRGRTRTDYETFHLIDSYQFSDVEDPSGCCLGSLKWGDKVSQWLQTSQMAMLDFGFFRSLENPIAQEAYRYLHIRRLDGKQVYSENLQEYACTRLGLSPGRWPSDLKRTLDRVHAELIEKGFLESVTYETMKSQPGERPRQKVVIRFPDALPTAASPALPDMAADPAECPDNMAQFDTWWAAQPEEWREVALAAAEAAFCADKPSSDTIRQFFARHPHRRLEVLGPLLRARCEK